MTTDRPALAHLRHELRTPLNHIIGYSEMLLEELAVDDRTTLAEGLRGIHADARELLGLINDFLSPARVEADRVDLNRLPADLAAPLERILTAGAALQAWAGGGGAEALEADLGRIASAAAHLRHLVHDGVPAAAPGAGSLPMATAPPSDAPGGAARRIDRGRILVVDDNEENRAMLARRLGRDGHEVNVAASGREALAFLQGHSVDLVLLDVMMPELNGDAVLAQLKADRELRHIPVLMVSALDEFAVIIRCIELGADDYLAKPIDPVLLRARIGACLERKRLRDEVVAHVARIEHDLRTAREIQLGMVPADFPAPTRACPVELFATLQPARQVGGDLYDFFHAGPRTLCVVVADVSDKGAPAALFMARAKAWIRAAATLLRSASGAGPGPDDIVTRVNAELCRNNDQGMFVTLFFGMLDLETGLLRFCNAGHNVPYLVGPGDRIAPLEGIKGKPVGIRTTFTYGVATRRLAPGEGLFLFTDGITEAMDPAGALFSEERLEASLRPVAAARPEAMVGAILRAVREFAGAAPQSDDIAALAVRFVG